MTPDDQAMTPDEQANARIERLKAVLDDLDNLNQDQDDIEEDNPPRFCAVLGESEGGITEVLQDETLEGISQQFFGYIGERAYNFFISEVHDLDTGDVHEVERITTTFKPRAVAPVA